MVLFAKHPKVSEYDLSSVERILCGAAPLSAEIEQAVKNKLHLRNIEQGKLKTPHSSKIDILFSKNGLINWYMVLTQSSNVTPDSL